MTDTKGVRLHKFKNEEIHTLLKEKGELIEKIKSMQDEINKIEEDSRPIVNRIQKIKDQAIPLMKRATFEVELGEWEMIDSFDIEADEVVVKIVDRLEEEKLRIKEAKEKEANENNDSGTNEGEPKS